MAASVRGGGPGVGGQGRARCEEGVTRGDGEGVPATIGVGTTASGSCSGVGVGRTAEASGDILQVES